MIRRLSVALAGDHPGLRVLAVSDEHEPALDHESNRRALGRLDAVLGCGDLSVDYLCFLADAFHAPLALVRGNHDRGANWEERHADIAQPLDGRIESVNGIDVIGLSWPGRR